MYQIKNSNWKVLVIVLVGILTVVFMAIFGVQGSQNTAISLEEQVNSAKSGIQVQEMQRVSHVKNLVDCVKQYDKHEAEAHGIVTDDQRMKLHGCIGGNYSYIFIPTSIGIIGEIQCSCGEKFTFCELM